jgi:hypothetical protein
MLGVKPLVKNMERLLFERKINKLPSSADGYSLFPVRAGAALSVSLSVHPVFFFVVCLSHRFA